MEDVSGDGDGSGVVCDGIPQGGDRIVLLVEARWKMGRRWKTLLPERGGKQNAPHQRWKIPSRIKHLPRFLSFPFFFFSVP